MARIYGLNGKIRGRQGNNVFSVQNGTQVLKEYNPVVFNPRTTGQREQRTKFALAGKISSIVPSVGLVGLNGGSNRGRRARFVSLITRAASVSGTSNDLVASLPYESFVFGEGSLAQYSAVPTIQARFTGSEARTTVEVTVPAIALGTNPPQGYTEIVLVGLFDAATSRLDELQVGRRVQSTPNVFTFRIGQRRNVNVATWIVPAAPIEGLAAPQTSNLYDTETAVNLRVSASSFLSGYRFGTSVLLSVVPVLGTPSSSVSPSPVDDMRAVVEEALAETAVAEG